MSAAARVAVGEEAVVSNETGQHGIDCCAGVSFIRLYTHRHRL